MSDSAPTPLFDEAARLYVEYLPVVQEMERAFRQAVDKFLDLVRQSINDKAAPLQIDDEDKSTYRVWWLTKRKNAPEEVPYVWFSHLKPEIVRPGQLELTVNDLGKARILRPEVEQVLRQLELPSCCAQKKKAAEGGIATYVISYGTSANPVQEVADVLALILKAIEPFKVP